MLGTRSLLASVVVLVFTAAAPAQLQGPVFPPPGGVTFAGTGLAGSAGGRTLNYSAVDVAQFGTLLWGPASATAVQVALASAHPLTALNYSAADSALPGMARWTGSVVYSPPQAAPQTVPVRFTLTQLTPAPYLLTAPAAISGSGAVVDVLAGGSSFSVNILFEAFYGGQWTPVNALQQLPGDPATRTSFSGGFFWEGLSNPPCPADFNGDGLITTSDISAFLAAWFNDVTNGTLNADFNGSGTTTTSDITSFLAAWFAGVQTGCP
ncbi:MAG TPA: GC-type dockerin domain-anchored protein [Phycisphaerales bacterium]|nr:GC-type dockerin domain-anchored protein [Phycisphaerales bacterium]